MVHKNYLNYLDYFMEISLYFKTIEDHYLAREDLKGAQIYIVQSKSRKFFLVNQKRQSCNF